MVYLAVVAIVFSFIILYLGATSKNRHKKRLEKIRTSWGVPKTEEVNIIGLLIEAMQAGHQNLFILDEVFKGTNSVERTALGKAILSYLNRGDNIVMVSTHDVELSDLLKDEYDLYHFSETIENSQLHFDHILKPGPLKTRNAIRLLELGNFPEDIIREARSLTSTSTPASSEVNG